MGWLVGWVFWGVVFLFVLRLLPLLTHAQGFALNSSPPQTASTTGCYFRRVGNMIFSQDLTGGGGTRALSPCWNHSTQTDAHFTTSRRQPKREREREREGEEVRRPRQASKGGKQKTGVFGETDVNGKVSPLCFGEEENLPRFHSIGVQWRLKRRARVARREEGCPALFRRD